MQATNNWGRQVTCLVCQKTELKSYSCYTPPFASAMNSVFIGWCEEHESEGLSRIQQAVQSADRINTAGSNS